MNIGRHPLWRAELDREFIAVGLKINTYDFLNKYRVRKWW
jgi:hypothetical protein